MKFFFFEIFFYYFRKDQAGCGESFQVEDVEKETPQLLTIEYYVNELQTIVDELVGKKKPFYICGSSWGTVLAQEFALTCPTGLIINFNFSNLFYKNVL